MEWAVKISAFSLAHAKTEFGYCVNFTSLHTVIRNHRLEKERIANMPSGIKYSSILTETFLGCIDKGFGRKTFCCFRLVRQIHALCNSWMTVSQERCHGCRVSSKRDIGREAGAGSWSKWPSSQQPLKSAPGGDFLPRPEGPQGAGTAALAAFT